MGYEFKPFEKVLVRDHIEQKWKPDIFKFRDEGRNNKFIYICLGDMWDYCVPYKGYEYLYMTNDDLEDECNFNFGDKVQVSHDGYNFIKGVFIKYYPIEELYRVVDEDSKSLTVWEHCKLDTSKQEE